MYIIQTNTSLDDNNNPRDFQSVMYKINKQNWDEFKEYILSEEDFTEKVIQGTMIGSTKPKFYKLLEILINDDFHLEIIISKYDESKMNIKYYMVTDSAFSRLI
ncbi:MAG: hypothetical protein PHT02_00725 [Tissierellia bacterium]|nr:hypothetical protein [Tissierellia bacterium]